MFYNEMNKLRFLMQLYLVLYFSTDLNKNIMRKIEFKTAKEMVNWLMDNERIELADGYGRRWKYVNFSFYFKNIGTHDTYQETIDCLHLYGTPIGIVGS